MLSYKPYFLVALIICSFHGWTVRAQDFTFFENKIRPVLVEYCYECHAAGKKIRGGLSLDTKEGLLKGGDSGPAIDPKNPQQSLFLKVLSHSADIKMPPKGKLPGNIIGDLETWIKNGAPDPRTSNGPATIANNLDWKKAREFWSFKPVQKPMVPIKSEPNPIDAFLRNTLNNQQLRPNPPASPATLARRLSLTLTGLPPKMEDVEFLVKTPTEDSYNTLVEKYLGSREYAEKWARHWLDVARYAEDQAHTFAVKPNTEAWRYRDWVITAFENDMPYDRFISYQICADLMPEPERKTNLAALGFFGLGAQYYKNSDAARAIADELDDRVDTLSRGFLGLTLSCARCHDHKYDPIPTQDYYSIAGIFHSSKLANTSLATLEEAKRYDEAKKKYSDADHSLQNFLRSAKEPFLLKKCEELKEKLLELEGYLQKRKNQPNSPADTSLDALNKFLEKVKNDKKYKFLTDPWNSMVAAKDGAEKNKQAIQARDALVSIIRDEKKSFSSKNQDKNKQEILNAFFDEKGLLPLGDSWKRHLESSAKEELSTLEKNAAQLKDAMGPEFPIVHAITEANPLDMKVYVRGNPANQGALAPRRFLRVVSGDTPKAFTSGSGRLELARAISDPSNPLTARVMANRIWAWTFGKGIVSTPSNFGFLGEKPSHPELLDWLASHFMESGWSVKTMVRTIVQSKAFKASSETNDQDAANTYLSRFPLRRLDVECWRDSVLAVSGNLEKTAGGPTFNLNDSNSNKRTIYAKISRHDLHSLLRLFDFPDPNITSEKRVETTIPQQQLFMINSPFVQLQSKAFAKSLAALQGGTEDKIRKAYQTAFSRNPEPTELAMALAFLGQADDNSEKGTNRQDRLERFCQAILVSNEFLFMD